PQGPARSQLGSPAHAHLRLRARLRSTPGPPLALAHRGHALPVPGRGGPLAARVPSQGSPGRGLLGGRGGAHAPPRRGGAGGAMRPDAPPPPVYSFGYRTPPVSGNAINGLGQAEKTRARKVFHASSGEPLAWKALDDFFSIINPWRVVRHVLFNTWQLRRSDGPVASQRREVGDPAAMAVEIKALARRLGASLVGVAEVTEDALYE